MANLFRRLLSPNYQQLRYLPRFSASLDENILNPTNNRAGPQSDPEEHSSNNDKDYLSPQRGATLNRSTPSLVIRSHNSGNKKKKVDPKTFTEMLLRDTKDQKLTTTDREGKLFYTKMHDKDPRITRIMANVKTKIRGKKQFLLLEGGRLIREALQTGCTLEYILFSRLDDVEDLKEYLPKKGNLYKVPYREIQTWSDLTTSPGIMGIFQQPTEPMPPPENSLKLTIVCDNIREPNNLGAIIRTACSVGCEKLILTKGCVNLWDSKVLRSSCGAHFRMHITKAGSWEEVESTLPESSIVFLADNDDVDADIKIPCLPYYAIDFSLPKHVVIVIGGETEGLSEESYILAQNFNGARINIPMSNGVESLNSGTALGVIAFEVKRQLMSALNKKKDDGVADD